MSRQLSRHRKSHSTSALSAIANQPGSSHLAASTSTATTTTSTRERRQSRMTSQLPVVQESASMQHLPGLSEASTSSVETGEGRRKKRSESRRRRFGVEEFESWLTDLRSLRSSARRRLAALKNVERCLVSCCAFKPGTPSSKTSVTMDHFVQSKVHIPLIALLGRHAQTLSSRSSHSSLPAGDEVATALIPELEIMVSTLQGLCLISRSSKKAVGESWVMEMFIDLLLLLRTQTPVISTPSSTENSVSTHSQPIVYCILDLLFCVLVDTPTNARVFEDLGGLEAVTRLLKGTSVAKEVRMKCIEFLYFYLLPEQTTSQRATSSSSTSSSSSSNSTLFPPSPLTSLTHSDVAALAAASSQPIASRTTRTPEPTQKEERWKDIDLPFVPMTPRKPPKPALGFLTPSTRRVSSGMSSIPPSPRGFVPPSPSSRRLSDLNDLTEMNESPYQNSQDDESWSREESGVGLGLGLPRSTSRQLPPSSTRNVSSSTVSSAATPQMPQTPGTPSFADPFTFPTESRTSSTSSSATVVPRGMVKSSTQPSLSILQSSTSNDSPKLARRSSQSRGRALAPTPETRASAPAAPTTSKMRHSRTQSRLSDQLDHSDLTSRSTRNQVPPSSSTSSGLTRSSSTNHLQKTRHSLAPSHYSSIKPVETPPPPLPLPTIASSSKETSDRTPSSTSSTTSTRPPRAFPASLTKGIPPSSSSPALAGQLSTALRATRRISSGTPTHTQMLPPPIAPKSVSSKDKDGGREKGKGTPLRPIVGKEVRSVEEKKGLLGEWLGNVDALVQGVEKVSFWGSVGGRNRAR